MFGPWGCLLVLPLHLSVTELQPPVELTELKKDTQMISYCIEPNVSGVTH